MASWIQQLRAGREPSNISLKSGSVEFDYREAALVLVGPHIGKALLSSNAGKAGSAPTGYRPGDQPSQNQDGISELARVPAGQPSHNYDANAQASQKGEDNPRMGPAGPEGTGAS